MENNDILQENIFIDKALSLYGDIISGRTYEEEIQKTVAETHFIGSLYKKKIVNVKKEIPVVEFYNKHIYALTIHPLQFYKMWQFCQFVRWAEKIVFYRNTIDKTIYVDSAIDDYDCRLLVYTAKDFQIKFKLEKVDNPAYSPNTLSDILSMKNDIPKYFKCMKIVVERNYGKCMTNHFSIIDDNIDFEDDTSNELLYKTIDNKVLDAEKNIIREIYNSIYNIYHNCEY
jgi:hypothetical protein